MQGELFHGMEKNLRHTEELEDEKPVERTSYFEKIQLTLSFDKIVIISISMVVVLAVTFAMGVEKGKQKAMKLNAQAANGVQTNTIIQQEWSSKNTDVKQEEAGDTTLSSESVATESESGTSVLDEMRESKNSLAITPEDFSQRSSSLKLAEKKQAAPVVDQTKALKKSADDQNKRYTIRLASYLKQAPAKSTATKLNKKGYETFVKQSGKYFVLNVGRFSGKNDAQQTLTRLRKELGIGKEGFIRTI